MSARNVQLAREGFAAAVRGDFDLIAGLLDPDVKWHGGDPASGCRDRGEALDFMRQATRRGPGWLVDVFDAGDDCVVLVMQPPGEPGESTPARRANVTRFRDGRVVEMVAYESPEAAWVALGQAPPVDA